MLLLRGPEILPKFPRSFLDINYFHSALQAFSSTFKRGCGGSNIIKNKNITCRINKKKNVNSPKVVNVLENHSSKVKGFPLKRC